MKQRQRKSQYTKREKQRTYTSGSRGKGRANKPAKEDNLQQAIVYLQGVEESHRQEILQDVQARRNVELTSLSFAGIVISAALANFTNLGMISYFYPILSYYLVVGWRRDNNKIGDNKWFVREFVEKVIAELFKENFQKKIITWEVLSAALSEMKKTLTLKKADLPNASWEELLQLPDIRFKMADLLGLSVGDVPPSFIRELVYHMSTPSRNLVKDGARGLFIVPQILTVVIATASCIIRVLMAASLGERVLYAIIGIIFLIIDIVYIVRTALLIKHERR